MARMTDYRTGLDRSSSTSTGKTPELGQVHLEQVRIATILDVNRFLIVPARGTKIEESKEQRKVAKLEKIMSEVYEDLSLSKWEADMLDVGDIVGVKVFRQPTNGQTNKNVWLSLIDCAFLFCFSCEVLL